MADHPSQDSITVSKIEKIISADKINSLILGLN